MNKPRRFSVAVVGATGAVGEALLAVLEERVFPVDQIYAVARAEVAVEDEDGEPASVLFAERPVPLTALADFDFQQCQIAFFCAPAAVAKKYAPKAIKAGCTVIDVSSQFRLDTAVPLLVADINAASLGAADGARLLASPSASALQLASILQPLANAVGIQSVDVTAMTAVSAFGRPGVNELAGQTARLLNAQSIKPQIFPAQIAFNVIPAFDAIDESGYTHDELNIAAEIKKLLADERIRVGVTQVFVPVFYGHSQVVRIETAAPLTAAEAGKLLAAAPGIDLVKSKKPFGPIDGGVDGQSIRVGRIRQSPDSACVLTLWSVVDNIRKGAAVNSVQIAETLLKLYL
jgi:aspartate-semialdehyde dehydrogenase